MLDLAEQRTNKTGWRLGLVEVREGIGDCFLQLLFHRQAFVPLGDVVLLEPLGLGLVLQNTPLLRCKRTQFFQGVDTFMAQRTNGIGCIQSDSD